jgi:prepilin-type processing-associated H-X9-DG protein
MSTRKAPPSGNIAYSFNSIENPGIFPMMMDGAWADTDKNNGVGTQDTQWNADVSSKVANLQGNDASNTATGRVCMNRHDMAINIAFADGHAGPVKLKLLWHQQWYNDYQQPTTANDILLPTN